jgi:hypothetical protein
MKTIKIPFGENGYKRIYNVLDRMVLPGDTVLVNEKDLHTVTAVDNSLNILVEGCAAFVRDDYQVVEFSGLGELDGVRYKEEMRKPNIGESILITKGDSLDNYVQKGEIGEVNLVCVSNIRAKLSTGWRYVGNASSEGDDAEYVVLVPALTREEVIEKAKQDIEDLKAGKYYAVKNNNNDKIACEAYFIRSFNKITVSLKVADTGEVLGRGHAICLPNDCFNWHIGCAIALHRALGLNVPRYYTYAPQPTKVHVGDIVTHKIDKQIFKVGKVDGESCFIVHEGKTYPVRTSHLIVLDDSRLLSIPQDEHDRWISTEEMFARIQTGERYEVLLPDTHPVHDCYRGYATRLENGEIVWQGTSSLTHPVNPATCKWRKLADDEDVKKDDASEQEEINEREYVIRAAKHLLEQYKNDELDGNYLVDGKECNAEFVVNREKRTVVCLIRGINTKKVHARGIAKCMPYDCFNIHIGKAIALCRALGKAVPDYLLNAPNPTEPQVGDVVEFHHHNGSVCGVLKVTENRERDPGLWVFRPEYGDRVIDDSRE